MANELENTEKTEQTEQTPSVDELNARIKALESENTRLRQTNTNASAEASKYKKELKEKDDALKAKMTEEERAKAESEAANAAMQQELETLRKERNIAKYTSALVAPDIGMDAETAKAVAEALNANEIDKVFDGIRKFITAHDKSLRESALMNNQTLQTGATEKAMTQEEFDNLPYKEMLAFKIEHPEQYKEFTKN